MGGTSETGPGTRPWARMGATGDEVPRGNREGARAYRVSACPWLARGAWPVPWRRERTQRLSGGVSHTERHEATAAAHLLHHPTCCQDHPGRCAQGVAVTR